MVEAKIYPIDRLIKRLERMIDAAREFNGKPPKYNKKRPIDKNAKYRTNTERGGSA
jgi:hypothetical protein